VFFFGGGALLTPVAAVSLPSRVFLGAENIEIWRNFLAKNVFLDIFGSYCPLSSLSDDLRDPALTVSDVFSRVVCFQSTSTSSALEVLHSMRYINLRFTYLLTYLLSPLAMSANENVRDISSPPAHPCIAMFEVDLVRPLTIYDDALKIS